ncbi:MAG TPA: DinB family protein [Acidobacteriaceae bacterium]|nr:DinB family protein [Acidobacteriaceae bacterium]
MSIAELLLQDYDAEMKSTRRVLERIPDDNPEYKCHEKSMPLGRLAMHVATLPAFGKVILTTPGMDMADPNQKFPDNTWRTRDIALATFDAAAAEARAALAASSDADLAAEWKFAFGDMVIANAPRSASYRMFFFNHLLHHRAQLSVYLRLNDIPVPGIYGPSADEPFNPAAKPA